MTQSTNPFRILSPTAILGYGFPETSFEEGLAQHPHAIAVDAGSIDPGPYYLGSGKSFTSQATVKRDLEWLLKACVTLDIPLLIGTAGGSGARPHVDWGLEIIKQIASEQNLSFPLATVYADIPKEKVIEAYQSGQITSLGASGELTLESIYKTTRIVAQMGSEPVLEALRQGAQVVLCGRCYDPVPFAAPAILQGRDAGLALHMGKILECAAIATIPGSGSDCILGTLYDDHFVLESLNPERRFTKTSTAAHSLYEKSNPYQLFGPGGYLDLEKVQFQEIGEGRVAVSGATFQAKQPYQIKLEGAAPVGFRTISIAGVRDPQMLQQIDTILGAIKKETLERYGGDIAIHFHVYGKNAVMGDYEPITLTQSHELGLVFEVIATTQALSEAACGYLRSRLLHYGYPHRMSTAGNLAFPFSPSDILCGITYGFTLYHLMEVADPCEFFNIQMQQVTS